MKVLHKEMCGGKKSQVCTSGNDTQRFSGIALSIRAQFIHALALIKPDVKILQRDQFFIDHCADRPNELWKWFPRLL